MTLAPVVGTRNGDDPSTPRHVPFIVFVSAWLQVNTWRCVWPAAELNRRGHPSVFVGKEGSHGFQPHKGDVILIHANNQDVGHQGTVRHFRLAGCQVWVQFDDDYFSLGDLQSTAGWLWQLKMDLMGAIKEAHGIIVATPRLAEVYGPYAHRCVTIRNWLPEWVTTLEINRVDPPMAGWFGTVDAHARDLEWLGAEAKRIRRLGVIGHHEEFARITGADLVWKRPVIRPPKLYDAIGAFSVGIAPAKADTFNEAKSWIKPLEFGALGIPTVASDIRPYRELREDGFNPLALVDDAEMMGATVDANLGEAEAGGLWPIMSKDIRHIVRTRYTLEARGGAEWEAWAEDVTG